MGINEEIIRKIVEINVLTIHKSLADFRYVDTHLNFDISSEIELIHEVLSKLKNKLEEDAV